MVFRAPIPCPISRRLFDDAYVAHGAFTRLWLLFCFCTCSDVICSGSLVLENASASWTWECRFWWVFRSVCFLRLSCLHRSHIRPIGTCSVVLTILLSTIVIIVFSAFYCRSRISASPTLLRKLECSLIAVSHISGHGWGSPGLSNLCLTRLPVFPRPYNRTLPKPRVRSFPVSSSLFCSAMRLFLDHFSPGRCLIRFLACFSGQTLALRSIWLLEFFRHILAFC